MSQTNYLKHILQIVLPAKTIPLSLQKQLEIQIFDSIKKIMKYYT